MSIALHSLSRVSMAELLHQRWFWLTVLVLGYVVALNGAVWGLGAHFILFLSVPTALLPLIPAYMPAQRRFRTTALLGVGTFFTLVGLILQTSYLELTVRNLLEMSGKLLLVIPSFFVRGPLQLFLGYSNTLTLLSGAVVITLFSVAVYRVPRLSDRVLTIVFAVLFMSMFLGFVECIEFGKMLKDIGASFYYDGPRVAFAS